MPRAEQAEIRQIVVDWTDAIARGDRDAILDRHADDLLMFDFPNTVEGLKNYDATWDFFCQEQRGPITFSPSDIRVSAGDSVAFVSCAMHCDGTAAGPLDFRLTVGLERRDGDWIITHEHHSMPTTDAHLIDQDPRG